MNKSLWLRGLLAAGISGAAGGIITGFAAIGIAPEHFNLVEPGLLLKVGGAASLVNAVVGVAGYLQKSPLPEK